MRTRFQALRYLVAFGLLLPGCLKASRVAVPDGGGLDSGAPRPTLQPGCVVFSSQLIDFGNVVVNTTATKGVTVTNNCGLDLDVAMFPLKGTDPLLFATIPLAGTVITLHDRESTSVTVQFTPLIVPRDPNEAYFAMGLCIGGPHCESLVRLRGRGISTGAWVEPTTLDYCFGPPGKPRSLFVTFSNLANAPIHLTADPSVLNTTSAGGMTSTGPFQPGAGFPTKDTVVPPYSAIQFPVIFTPPTSDLFTGEIHISTDDATSSDIAVPLSGYGGGATIACNPPALDFGPTATGTNATLKVTCTNVGTDVPGHPEARLFIPDPSSSDLGLAIQNGSAAFQASFDPDLPIGGLLAGQSATIDVRYGPTVAGTDTDTLEISSNDCANPKLPIALSATALSLAPCDFKINPETGIAFGHVDQGTTAVLPFVIANNGTDDCLASAIQITPGSALAFSLPDYPVGSGSASTTIPAGGSLEVRVQFAPTAVQAAFAGSVSLTVSNPDTPHPSVSLSGSSLIGCLLIEPSVLDFGIVSYDDQGFAWCKSLKRTVTLRNVCPNEDLVVNSISVADLANNHETPQPEFILTGDPSPVTIPRPCAVGDTCPPVIPVTFQMSFEPFVAGRHSGGVAIQTSDSLVHDPYLVSVSGDAEHTKTQVDQFTGYTQAVDLLWVVDTDDDTAAQQSVISDLPNFLSFPFQNGIDLHMATTSTDVYANPDSEDGRMEPCPGCKINGSAVHVVSSSIGLGDAVSALSRLLNLGAGASCVSGVTCNGFAVDEQFFETMYEALSPAILSGYNQAFYRSDAFLAIIVINDDSEDDYSEAHGLNFYYNAYIALKGATNARKFSVSYVNNYGGLQSNQKMPQMVQLTGGVEADLSNTGTPNWTEELAALWPQLATQFWSYPLSNTPLSAGITVTINGVVLPATESNGLVNWTYDLRFNLIHFVQATAPQAGDQVAVSYALGCP